MVDIEKFKTSPMGKALVELSEEMGDEHIPPITINAVGGFALMLHGKRDIDSVTDIDYIGTEFSQQFNKIADRIGNKHKLGTGWINNDIMVSGYTLDDFTASTGELHFTPAGQIGNIAINVLEEKDLLKLKIIAIDTSLMACEYEGDFTRRKDLADIKNLMQSQNMTIDDIRDKWNDMILGSNTMDVLQSYLTKGDKEVDRKIKEIATSADIANQNTTADYTFSPFVQNLLNNAYKRAQTLEDEDDTEEYN